MPRPTLTTPVETTVTVVRSTVKWTKTYADALAGVLGDDWDGPAVAEEVADSLETDEQTYVREKREDVGMTNKRTQAVKRTQKLVASAAAMARLAFEDHPNVSDIVADFAPQPPSRVRSPNTAQAALTRIQAALEIHGDDMRGVLANVDELDAEVADTTAELDEVLSSHATETQETKAARRKRDASRKRAVSFVCRLQLAAESVGFVQPDALEDLHAIFEAHMPEYRPTIADEDSEDGEDPVEDTDTPSQPETPAREDEDTGGSDTEDVDEPVEA